MQAPIGEAMASCAIAPMRWRGGIIHPDRLVSDGLIKKNILGLP
ncbi:hypothetical protein [Bradyrhizobium sp. Arg816]|nr:hypothetical protein [Bradyrhizobium sp. Arg816]MDI3567173.1 hypothetical protein [Bradyrhizobium sp. Arg816]